MWSVHIQLLDSLKFQPSKPVSKGIFERPMTVTWNTEMHAWFVFYVYKDSKHYSYIVHW